jgi:hypothetical protein
MKSVHVVPVSDQAIPNILGIHHQKPDEQHKVPAVPPGGLHWIDLIQKGLRRSVQESVKIIRWTLPVVRYGINLEDEQIRIAI